MTRTARTTILSALALAVFATPAGADGLPVLGVDVGAQGVTVRGSHFRNVALPARGGTMLQRIQRRGGAVVAWRFVRSRLTIPAVAYDATAGGLSADGRTLVLIRPRTSFPQRRTRMVIADARKLTFKRDLTLRGDFSFDALSPDGRSAYLIHYTSPRDYNRYEVLRLDTTTGAIDPDPVLEPREPDEAMAGAPLSRAASPDGRWAYTLYDGAGHEPFVHALDTTGVTARCIDLPALEGRDDLAALHLQTVRRGAAVRIVRGDRALQEIDTRTWAVGAPRKAAPAAAQAPAGDGDGPSRWWLVPLAVLVALLLAMPRLARVPARLRAQ